MYQFPDELRKVYESSPLSFAYYENIHDRAVPVLVSDGLCRNTCMSREEVMEWLSIGLFERIHPNDVGLVSQVSDEFLHHRGTYNIVFRCRIAPIDPYAKIENSDERYVQIHGVGKWQTMPDGKELVVISYANLSKTKEAYRETMELYALRQSDLFYTDQLTGLPNINYLKEFAEEKINSIRADGKTPYLIFSDIEAMQSYNNQYGLEGGDRLLCLTAETLKKLFPAALIVRGADDHFIVISTLNDAAEIEERLHEANRIIREEAEGNTLGFRSGVCPMEPGTTLNLALDHAKHAVKFIETDMTRAVEHFSQAVDDTYWRKRYIVENIAQAMKNEWISVFYHALYRIENRKIAAFEGLARWVDPERGVIPPKDFIPVLIKYHQLYKLDLYMFDQVCRKARSLYDNGLPLVPVSVNFSRQDFDHADIIGEMNRIYNKYELGGRVDKSFFIVEITEQDLAVGTDQLQKELEQIRQNGYGLWLDDFGSGYSALNVFSRFDFDMIKCDLDLLQHLDDHGGINRVILRELVDVARQIGIHVLIEGLETEEHLAFVKEIGCELVQGFYYHKPEPIEELLKRQTCAGLIKLCETQQERYEQNHKWLNVCNA